MNVQRRSGRLERGDRVQAEHKLFKSSSLSRFGQEDTILSKLQGRLVGNGEQASFKADANARLETCFAVPGISGMKYVQK